MDTVFVDRKEYPDLFIEPVPQNQFSFINGYGDTTSCKILLHNGVPNKWIEIDQFNNQFCFYLWYGPGGLTKYLFCEDTFYEIFNSGDHPEPTRVITFSKKSDKEFIYIVEGQKINPNQQPDKRTIHFYIIDPQNNVAIVKDNLSYPEYKLMIAQEDLYNIPILVQKGKNYSPDPYMGFDTVNYKKVLNDNGFIDD